MCYGEHCAGGGAPWPDQAEVCVWLCCSGLDRGRA